MNCMLTGTQQQHVRAVAACMSHRGEASAVRRCSKISCMIPMQNIGAIIWMQNVDACCDMFFLDIGCIIGMITV